MDKYSLKIKNITDKLLIKNIQINKTKFINKLYQTIQNTYSSDINIPKYTIKNLKKIHTINDESLLFKFYKLYKPNEIKSLSDFIRFYIENNLIDIDKIKNDILKNDELTKLFNEIYFDKDERLEIKDIFYKSILINEITKILSDIMEFYILIKLYDFLNDGNKKIIIYAGLYHIDNIKKLLIKYYKYKEIDNYGITNMNDIFSENRCIKLIPE